MSAHAGLAATLCALIGPPGAGKNDGCSLGA